MLGCKWIREEGWDKLLPGRKIRCRAVSPFYPERAGRDLEGESSLRSVVHLEDYTHSPCSFPASRSFLPRDSYCLDWWRDL